MFWADEIAAEANGRQVVNDSKTPSGTVHVGSLRGPVIHDAIWRALRRRGTPADFLYGVDDLAAMDSAAHLSGDALDRFMGVPLAHVPAPPGSAADNYARHFVGELFLPVFARLGIRPQFYWSSELYASGAMDPFIRAALDRAEVIRDIYLRVSRVERPTGWLPVQVICDRCGRVGTTLARDWDGATVAYECRVDYVTWARGCGFAGRVAPFGGRATLPWNVDWAARWSHLGVTIEGCGKDLATAGGSRDRADAIAREVFERDPPRNVVHEFLNVGGRKMSTSRGHGAAAHDMAAATTGEALRFLFLRPRPNHAIDFDPDGTDAIPRLFDELDRFAAATAALPVKGELPAEADRIFATSVVDPATDPVAEAAAYRPAFGHLALLLQVPGVDVAERLRADKGGPLSEREEALVAERLAAARAWLASYAPERARLAVQRDRLPAGAADLTAAQRGMLAALADQIRDVGWDGERLQAAIFGAARASGVTAGEAFAAIYTALLGQPHGPRAGWLLASLDRGFVLARLAEAATPTGSLA